MLIMLLIGLSNTPLVESGPAASATCLLKCISTVCGGLAMACKSLSLNCRIIEQGWLEIIRVIDTLLVYLIILHTPGNLGNPALQENTGSPAPNQLP